MAEYVCEFVTDRSTVGDKMERVVRCLDCRYSFRSKMTGWLLCEGPIQGASGEAGEVEPEGFCACGEPGEVGDE